MTGVVAAAASAAVLVLSGLGAGWAATERAVAIAIVAGLFAAIGAALGAGLARLGWPSVSVAVGVLVVGLGLASRGVGASDGRGRTVVLVTIDTLRRDHVGVYPDASIRGVTPALDAVAADAIRFDEAITPSPLTLPSHTAMLTGRAPWETGVVRNGRRLPELETVATALADDGFVTAAFTSTALLDPALGLEGFDVYRAPGGSLAALGALSVTRPLLNGARVVGLSAPEEKLDGAVTVDRALDWIAAQPADASLFLWVHLYDPHQPHGDLDGAGSAELGHPCDWEGHVSGLRRGGAKTMQPALFPLTARCRSRDWSTVDELVATYASEVRHADEQVGRLVGGLTDLGRWESAGVVVASDHGESLVQHQALGGHQFWLYDPVIRVPLFVRDPGCDACAGSVRRDRVDLTQVAATLATLGGVDVRGAPSLLDVGPSRVVTVGPAPVFVDGIGPALQASARIGGGKVILAEDGHLERYLVDRDPTERTLYLTADEEQALRQRVDETRRAWAEGKPSPVALAVAPPRALAPEVHAALDAIEVTVIDDLEVMRFSDADRRLREALRRARQAVDARGEVPIEGETQLRLLGYVD